MIQGKTHSQQQMASARIGIIGTGFIAVGLCLLMRSCRDMNVSRVLTRRPMNSVDNIDGRLLTHSLDEVLCNSDIIVECSGDIIHASKVVNEALKAGLPVITMGSEFHVTVGSYFCQPGSLAALQEEALQMGFTPLVYVISKDSSITTHKRMKWLSGPNAMASVSRKSRALQMAPSFRLSKRLSPTGSVQVSCGVACLGSVMCR